MPGGGEDGHVGPGLGDDDFGDEAGDAGDAGRGVPGRARKGAISSSIRASTRWRSLVWASIRSRNSRAMKAWCSLKRPVSASMRAGDLRAHPRLGQLSQDRGIVLPADQCLEHGPARDPGDVRGDGGELDPGVLQHLLQPLDLPGAFIGDRGPGPGQVPESGGFGRRNETAPDQTVCAELRQPRRVGDIGLASGQVPGIAGIDQFHVQAGILEQEIELAPVIARGLDNDQCDLLARR